MPKKRGTDAQVAPKRFHAAATKSKTKSQDWPAPVWLCLGLGLLILIFYANSFSADLLFDSDILIRLDPRLRTLNRSNIEQILTHSYWWPYQESNLYRPLTTISYLVNYAVFGNGDKAAGYHAVNILLHWTNAWLVLLIIRRLMGRFDVAALTASLFAVHPVNTESVTNVVGRADLMATLCVLFGGWCYLRALVTGARKVWWLAVLGVTACLGVVAKENAVMIVAFVALYDFLWRWPLLATSTWYETLKKAVKEFGRGYAALVPGLVLIWLIRRWMVNSTPVFGHLFADNPLIGAAPFQGFMTAMGVIGRYLKLLVFPRTLACDYSFNQIPLYGTAGNSGADTVAWVSLIVVTVLAGTAMRLRRRQRVFSWGVLFMFVMMLPTSNLLVTIGSIMAERFLYLPSIGFCAVAALALCGVGEAVVSFAPRDAQWPRITYWILPVVIICALGVRTFYRNADWHDDLSLWRGAVAASPESFKAHMTYGDSIWTDAQRKSKPPEQAIDEVIVQQEIARSILEPEPPIPLKFQNNAVHLRLGRYYRIKGEFLDGSGRHDEAVRYYQKSLDALIKAQVLDRLTNQARREFGLAHGVPEKQIPDAGNLLVYQLLGVTYGKLGQWENSEAAGRFLEHIAPDQPLGYQIVGAACFNLSRYADAAVQFMAGLLIDPGNGDWLTTLSITYNKLGVEPNPVTQQAAGMSLNQEIPLVRQQLNTAAATVVRLFEEAKQLEHARELREQLIKRYSIPPEVFSKS